MRRILRGMHLVRHHRRATLPVARPENTTSTYSTLMSLRPTMMRMTGLPSARLAARLSVLLLLPLAACSGDGASAQTQAAPSPPEGSAVAYFAGGCFWCMERPFEALNGVSAVVSGYTDGEEENPTYRQVSSGGTGHTEAIRVVYNPSVITYAELLRVFWHNIDPTDAGGQFCDRGSQYRSGVYVQNAEERRLAEASRQAAQEELRARGNTDRIVTEIKDASTFYDAEDYHQNYYRNNPARYTRYRRGCGRDARLEVLWGSSGH